MQDDELDPLYVNQDQNVVFEDRQCRIQQNLDKQQQKLNEQREKHRKIAQKVIDMQKQRFENNKLQVIQFNYKNARNNFNQIQSQMKENTVVSQPLPYERQHFVFRRIPQKLHMMTPQDHYEQVKSKHSADDEQQNLSYEFTDHQLIQLNNNKKYVKSLDTKRNSVTQFNTRQIHLVKLPNLRKLE